MHLATYVAYVSHFLIECHPPDETLSPFSYAAYDTHKKPAGPAFSYTF